MLFFHYIWPYPPLLVFLLTALFSIWIQMYLKLKKKRKWRLLLPVVSAVIFVCAVVAVIFLPPPPGVFLGELSAGAAVALPGIGILAGVIVGELIAWVIQGGKRTGTR